MTRAQTTGGADPIRICGPATGSSEERGPVRVFLPAGGTVVSADPCDVTTILGSCVAVCLWDGGRQIGGMSHYLLPRAPESATGLARYGDTAIAGLVGELVRLGASATALRAKVFGGACVLAAFRGVEDHIGRQNVSAARTALAAERIAILERDVGGERGRKIRFRTDDGSASVKRI